MRQNTLLPGGRNQPQASLDDYFPVPGVELPSVRTGIAIKKGADKNLLINVWGGLGDQACAEPTLRWALRNFKGVDISLAAPYPEMFAHLKFKKVYNRFEAEPPWNDYLVFNTITPAENLTWEFFAHSLVNCVDYASMCAFRMQLPIQDRQIYLSSTTPSPEIIRVLKRPYLLLHAGRHWPSKTFPTWWWNTVIEELTHRGITPVLIGADQTDNRGTVDVDSTGCLDLRNKTSISELIWLCQRAGVILTNDSSPLHLGASSDPQIPPIGTAWLGFVSTAKHPDFLSHWRHGTWAWREVNHSLDGMWNHTDVCPNKSFEIRIDQCSDELLLKFLPNPTAYARWAERALHGTLEDIDG